MTRLEFLVNLNDAPDEDLLHVQKLLHQAPGSKSRPNRKRIITFALAAALVLGLGAAAYALGLSIDRQRQEELRQELQIDENHVTDYVEYPVSEEAGLVPEEGAALLSTVNNGEFQRLWVVLHGVSPELIEDLSAPEQVDREGLPLPANGHRYRMIYCTLDGLSFFDGMSPLHFREGYDPESQSLLSSCAILLDELPEGQKRSLTFILVDILDYENDGFCDVELLQELGTVEIQRTDQSLRSFWFPEPVCFENGAYGEGEFLGLELSASGVNWILRHDGVDQMYRARTFSSEEERLSYLEMEQSWLQAIEALERDAVLLLADGGTREIGLPLRSSDPEGCIVKDICFFEGGTVDVNKVVGVSIGGKTFDLREVPGN